MTKTHKTLIDLYLHEATNNSTSLRYILWL